MSYCRLYRNVEASRFGGQRNEPKPVARNDPRLLAAIAYTLEEKEKTFNNLSLRKIDAYKERDLIEQLRNLYADICDLYALRVKLLTDGEENLLLGLPKYRPAVVANRGSYDNLVLMPL
jgi:hypothetical protein